MSFEILTPSYAPDFPAFELLHRSVLACTDAAVTHHVIVPDADVELFAGVRSDRLRITPYRDVLPTRFVSTAWFADAVARIPAVPRGARFVAVNRRHPWPPLRGWLLQQIVKLSVAARSDADALLLIDSDMQLIAPVGESLIRRDGAVRYYRDPTGISPTMTRHIRWHRNARRMLGLEPDGAPPYQDPIAGLLAWDPTTVRRCVERVAEVSGRPFEDEIARHWEFSEYVLYGEFLRELGTDSERSFQDDRTLCLNHWDTVPLTEGTADAFIASARPDDVSLRIQSTSHTPLELQRRIADRLLQQRS